MKKLSAGSEDKREEPRQSSTDRRQTLREPMQSTRQEGGKSGQEQKNKNMKGLVGKVSPQTPTQSKKDEVSKSSKEPESKDKESKSDKEQKTKDKKKNKSSKEKETKDNVETKSGKKQEDKEKKTSASGKVQEGKEKKKSAIDKEQEGKGDPEKKSVKERWSKEKKGSIIGKEPNIKDSTEGKSGKKQGFKWTRKGTSKELEMKENPREPQIKDSTEGKSGKKQGFKWTRKGTSKELEMKENPDLDQRSMLDQSIIAIRKAQHLSKMRLSKKSVFRTDSPKALSNAGFASLGVGMFAIFRPSPYLIHALASRLINTTDFIETFKIVVLCISFFWYATIIVILMIFGLLQTLSVYNLKRPVLLIHPWGLTALYLDVFVWLTIAIAMHLEIVENGLIGPENFRGIHHPSIVFIFIYIEICLYFMGYWAFATFFIAAELTLIEKFF